MDWESHSSPDEYEDKIAQTFSVLNWTQLIDFPTVGKNTLDVAITKSPESEISLEISEAFKNHFVSTNNRYLSEHIPIMIDVSWKNEYASKTSIVKAFSFCRGDYSFLRNLMTQTPFTPNCYSNIDVMVDEWYSWLLYLLQKSVPIRTKHRQSLPPWISPSTSNIMKRKETAIKKLNRGVRPSSDSILKVQKLSQELEEAVTHDKREYGISLCDSRNIATKFKYINFVKSDRSALPTLLSNGNSAVTDREKADLLIEYFVSVFVNPNGVDSNHTITIPSQTCTISDYCIKTTIAKICKDLNTRKSRGPDNVPPIVYKETAESIASSLHNVFKNIKRPGKYPTKWKNGTVTLILKRQQIKGRNYRPLTLLDIAGKIHERCIYIPLYYYFIKFVSSQQFGFQSRKSTIIQLLTCLHHIYFDNANSRKGLLFFDFAKAFDKVNHKILVTKLSSLGVQKSMLAVITDYLQNRRQAVKVNDQISLWAHVLSGVPQRSLLGPLLFLIFINDLSDLIFFSTAYLFADDLKLYFDK